MAFNVSLGAITVTVGMDADPLKKGANEAEKEVKDLKKELKTLGNETRANVNAWGKWAVGLTAAVTTGAAVLAKSNLSNIRELKNLASASNTVVEEFQRGGFAAGQFGIEIEKYGDILKDVNDRVGDFLTTGGGPMVDFFEQVAPKVGVTAEQFKKLSGQEALGLYINSLQKANLSQEEMTFFMEALASDSTRLIPLFKDNAAAFNDLTKEAEALGVGLSNVDVAQAELANKELAKAGAFIDSASQEFAVKLAPLIAGITEGFTDAAKEAGGMGNVIDSVMAHSANVVGVFADGLHGIQVLFKGVEVLARAVIAGAVASFEGLIDTLADVHGAIVDGLFTPLRSSLELAATFSDAAAENLKNFEALAEGMKIKGREGASAFQDAQLEAFGVARDELHNLMMQELPSQRIDEFIAQTSEKFTKMAQENAAALSGGLVGDPKDGPKGDPQDKKSEADRIREENEKILEALLEQSNIREETLHDRFRREREIVEKAQDDLTITEQEASDARKLIAENEARTKNKILSNSLAAAVTALDLGGKKAAKIQKNLAIANAVVSGGQAAVDAWRAGMSVGGPWAPLVAAAYTAASIAKTTGLINSIKSSSKPSGGGGTSMPSIPSGSPVGAGGGDASGTGQGAAPSMTINLVGEGSVNRDQLIGIFNGLNDLMADGMQLNVNTGA